MILSTPCRKPRTNCRWVFVCHCARCVCEGTFHGYLFVGRRRLVRRNTPNLSADWLATLTSFTFQPWRLATVRLDAKDMTPRLFVVFPCCVTSFPYVCVLCLLAVDNKYNWLWDWVDDHCPTTMQSDTCEGGCLDTPVETSCPDESMCSYAGEAHWTYCPYDTCRPEILGFVIRNLTPFADFMLFMTIFEVALLLINCLLICYNPRDNVEEMLIKAGTLTKKRSYVRRP